MPKSKINPHDSALIPKNLQEHRNLSHGQRERALRDLECQEPPTCPALDVVDGHDLECSSPEEADGGIAVQEDETLVRLIHVANAKLDMGEPEGFASADYFCISCRKFIKSKCAILKRFFEIC